MIRFFCTILLVSASLFATPVYQATYNNGSAANDGSYIYGLTSLTLTGPQNTVAYDSMCFDFAEHIYSGQTYQATLTKLTDASNDPDTQAKYDMAGFIYLAMHDVPTVSAILHISDQEALQGLQYGVWDLFDTDETLDGNIYHGYKYTNELDQVIDYVVDNPGELTTFTNSLKVQYAGVLDNLYIVNGYGRDSEVQKFIIGGDLPAGVPEPGSLGLLGSGLIGFAMLIRKRAVR